MHITEAPGTTAQLYDGLGRLVRTGALTQGVATLDVRGLPAGVYGVRTTDGRIARLVVE